MRLLDCHSDLMVDVFARRLRGERDVIRRAYLGDLRAGGVAGLVVTVGGDTANLCPLGRNHPHDSAVAMLDALHDEVVDAGGELAVVYSADELVGAMDAGTVALLPALEGASPLLGDIGNLERLHGLGLRQVGLTWNSRNELATGLGQGAGGLTEAGVRAVAAMNRMGVVVDVSHSSRQTFWDVAGCATAPFIASHSNAAAVCGHARNLDDDQLDEMRRTEGLVCATLYPDFVSAGEATLADLVTHVGHLLDRVGRDSVGFGADLTYFMRDKIAASVRGSGVRYAMHASFPDGVETYAALSRVTDALLAAGVDEMTVERIAWRGYVSLLRRVERATLTTRLPSASTSTVSPSSSTQVDVPSSTSAGPDSR